MSYYTEYELTVYQSDREIDLEEVWKSLDQIMGNDWIVFEIDDGALKSVEPLTWYMHDEDCAQMSRSFPGIVFKLHGEGDGGDVWDAYYQDGECQICRAIVSYPEFDPAKLTAVEQAQENDQHV